MADPFEVRSGGVLSRVIGGASRRGAIQQLERLLAEAARVSDVPLASVQDLAAQHRVDMSRSLRTARAHLYRRFLEHCLQDSHVSVEESADLAHLQQILALDAASVRHVHEEVAQQVYGAAIDQVLEDQQLDPEEEAFLRRLQGQLELPQGLADALLGQGVQRARQRFFSRAAARSGTFLVSKDAPLQLVGASERSIEEAVNDAIEQACRAVPRLHWIELQRIRGEVVDGRVKEWKVELKAWLDSED